MSQEPVDEQPRSAPPAQPSSQDVAEPAETAAEPERTNGAASDAAMPAPPEAKRPGRLRRVLSFFWRGEQVRDARAALGERSELQQRLLAHGRASAELGDRMVDPVEPLRAGRAPAVAVLLHRDAIRSLLAGLGALPTDVEVDPELHQALVAAAGDEKRWARAEELALRTEPLAELEAGRDLGKDDARLLQSVTRVLLARAAAPERRVRRLLFWRFGSLSALLALLVLIVWSSVALATRLSLGPDLTAGKAWRASSTYANFSPAKGEVDGKKSAIFFHTAEEDNPWLEYDLGSATTIRRVEVTNRTDCCSERTVPLAIEISADGQSWTEVARRNDVFERWTAKLPPTTTRYVRLRGLKKTWLHLESVVIR